MGWMLVEDLSSETLLESPWRSRRRGLIDEASMVGDVAEGLLEEQLVDEQQSGLLLVLPIVS